MNTPPEKKNDLLSPVEKFFSEKVKKFGASAQGVDYNSAESQEIRFVQLLRILPEEGSFSLLDYGCGYGATAEFMQRCGYRNFSYTGFDISEAQVSAARAHLPESAERCFTTDAASLRPHDYVIASGIFNMRLQISDADWIKNILSTLDHIHTLSTKGFAFNMLTSYSDADRMRPDLYYGDPCFFFNHCRAHYGRNVALLHDYMLYDWTLLVRK